MRKEEMRRKEIVREKKDRDRWREKRENWCFN
jgi:hypothetical protein